MICSSPIWHPAPIDKTQNRYWKTGNAHVCWNVFCERITFEPEGEQWEQFSRASKLFIRNFTAGLDDTIKAPLASSQHVRMIWRREGDTVMPIDGMMCYASKMGLNLRLWPVLFGISSCPCPARLTSGCPI